MKKIKTPGSCMEYLALTEKQKLQLLKHDQPPVQSFQDADTDPHEKDAIRCGESPFERNAER